MCFDYRSPSITEDVLKVAGEEGVKFVLDCIGSQDGSVRPIAKIVGKGSRVAVLLPVVVKDAAEGEGGEPIYEMDADKCADWKEGVVVKGVRTHFYLEVGLTTSLLSVL